MELISVIVPVYKVEAYLDRCVQSIVDQTYKNLEIILVDDGSPDRCPQLCDNWATKDPRIRVIHKINGGLSDARNAGMAVATGTYISFIDSDDWIDPNMFELLSNRLIEDNSDISACGIELFWEDGRDVVSLTTSGSYVLDTEVALNALFRESLLKQPVCSKLYKKELIHDLLFPVGKQHEDVFWSYLAVGRAKQVSIFDTPCYHYLQHDSSIMGKTYSLSRLDSLEAKELQLQYVRRHCPSLNDCVHVNLLFSCIYALQMTLRHISGPDKFTAIHRIHHIFKKHSVPLPSDITIKQSFWLILSKISLRGAAYLRNALNIGL